MPSQDAIRSSEQLGSWIQIQYKMRRVLSSHPFFALVRTQRGHLDAPRSTLIISLWLFLSFTGKKKTVKPRDPRQNCWLPLPLLTPPFLLSFLLIDLKSLSHIITSSHYNPRVLQLWRLGSLVWLLCSMSMAPSPRLARFLIHS